MLISVCAWLSFSALVYIRTFGTVFSFLLTTIAECVQIKAIVVIENVLLNLQADDVCLVSGPHTVSSLDHR